MKKSLNGLLAFLICMPLFSNAQENQPDSPDFSSFSVGEIVCSSNALFSRSCPVPGIISKSQKPYDEMVVGVIRKAETIKLDKSQIYMSPLIICGISDVKFNSENGAIKKGDPLTSSSTPGEAMKATQSGMIIGIAMEDAPSSSGLVKIRVMIQYVKQ